MHKHLYECPLCDFRCSDVVDAIANGQWGMHVINTHLEELKKSMRKAAPIRFDEQGNTTEWAIVFGDIEA